MIVLAISAKGAEYLYSSRSAHKVSKASAEKIAAVLNEKRHHLKDNQVWHIHEVDGYDNASIYAEDMRFSIRNGIVSDHYRFNYWK